MHKALHHRDYVDRLYVLKKEGVKGLTSIGDGVDASIGALADYIKKSKERLITATRKSTDNLKVNRTTTTTTTQKQTWEENNCIDNSSDKREDQDMTKKGTI